MVKKSKQQSTSNQSPIISTSTIIIISVLVGLIIGFTIGTSKSTSESHGFGDKSHEDMHDHSNHSHDIHSHEQLEVSPEMAPTIEILVHEDSKSGYNLEIETTNFEFVSTHNFENDQLDIFRGHAHLYINGEKISRLYSSSYYLGELEGYNEITVTLNSNDHKDLALKGETIQDTFILEVE